MSLNPIEVRLKLHDRMEGSYAKLQVCLCLDVASEEFDPSFDSRNGVEIVRLREGIVSPQLQTGRRDWNGGEEADRGRAVCLWRN